MIKETESAGEPTGAEAPTEIPERRNAQRKTKVILRPLRGEPIDAVARDAQVPRTRRRDPHQVDIAKTQSSCALSTECEEAIVGRVVSRAGIEPATRRLRVCCSAN
jgi:hypothetical protein